jgi:hypothetical protein
MGEFSVPIDQTLDGIPYVVVYDPQYIRYLGFKARAGGSLDDG